MRSTAVQRCLRALVLGLTLVFAESTASAQPTGLPAVITTGGSGLDAVAIQGAVERELGVALKLDPSATERLEIALTGRRANVTYYAPSREPVTRSVDLPRDNERALATIAFLAGNLARDEATELLRQLTPATDGEPDQVPRAEAVPLPPASPPAGPPPPAPTEVKKPPVPAAKSTEPELIETRPFAANASLFHPVTILKQTERRRLNFELGLAYSWVGAIRGGALTLGYLRVDAPSEGYTHALLWNRSGPMTGVQFAHIVSQGYGPLKGVSYGGFVNVREGNVLGVLGSAIYASSFETEGVEVAGIFANATSIRGVQAAGIVALSGDVTGVQAAAIVSVAKDVRGVQAAAVVNVAKKVRGLQLGVVNVADEIHGGAIGLVSIAKNGRLQPTLWLPGPGAGPVVGIKSVTDLTYTQIGFGYDPFNDRFRNDLGVGLHLDLGHRLHAETGVGYDETYKVGRGEQAFTNDSLVRSQLRYDVRFGFEPIRGVTPFIGGAVTRRLDGGGADFRGEYAFGLSLL